MSKHFIYHIFGKKIGCTNNVAIRMKQQNVKEGEYEILEEHTNAKTASVRERELQEQHGYRVDNIPYWKTIRNAKKAYTPEVQKKRVDNTDYKAFQKQRVVNTDYKAKAIKCEKSVLQFDKQGNFIKQWDSILKASIFVKGNTTNIGNCCRGILKSSSGYIWKFAN